MKKFRALFDAIIGILIWGIIGMVIYYMAILFICGIVYFGGHLTI